ncbi:MAG: hypothetical protein ACYCZN_01255 [Candidatus Dormibacteria bacterium]
MAVGENGRPLCSECGGAGGYVSKAGFFAGDAISPCGHCGGGGEEPGAVLTAAEIKELHGGVTGDGDDVPGMCTWCGEKPPCHALLAATQVERLECEAVPLRLVAELSRKYRSQMRAAFDDEACAPPADEIEGTEAALDGLLSAVAGGGGQHMPTAVVDGAMVSCQVSYGEIWGGDEHHTIEIDITRGRDQLPAALIAAFEAAADTFDAVGHKVMDLLKAQEGVGKPCRSCGCTDEDGCAAICYWVEPDLCSECASLGVGSDSLPANGLDHG